VSETAPSRGARSAGNEVERPALSIIVPLYNEEANVVPLWSAIDDALSPAGLDYEVLLVDDGSVDGTFEAAAVLARSHRQIRVVKLRRNYGQTAAMAAGIEQARGDVLVTMDGDLQNDPKDIPRFLATLEQGFDIVVGWRHDRKDKLWSRKVPSRIANALIGKVTGVPIRDNGCSLKAYRADVIKQIPLYSEMHRFIPAMASLAGPRIAEIKVRHHARRYGKSKYGLSRVYRVLLDLLTVKTIIGFASRPAGWFALLAMPAFFIAAVCIGASLYQLLALGQRFSTALAGVGVLFGALAFFMTMIGMLGEIVYKTGDAREHRFSMLTAEALAGAASGTGGQGAGGARPPDVSKGRTAKEGSRS